VFLAMMLPCQCLRERGQEAKAGQLIASPRCSLPVRSPSRGMPQAVALSTSHVANPATSNPEAILDRREPLLGELGGRLGQLGVLLLIETTVDRGHRSLLAQRLREGGQEAEAGELCEDTSYLSRLLVRSPSRGMAGVNVYCRLLHQASGFLKKPDSAWPTCV